jgi:hypothetical protein
MKEIQKRDMRNDLKNIAVQNKWLHIDQKRLCIQKEHMITKDERAGKIVFHM